MLNSETTDVEHLMIKVYMNFPTWDTLYVLDTRNHIIQSMYCTILRVEHSRHVTIYNLSRYCTILLYTLFTGFHYVVKISAIKSKERNLIVLSKCLSLNYYITIP
uniref:Uncharacterized protein n=1 Tax=Cacopsylla melanoneura TaxID=428564 RepID=A0A8D9BHZ4_9HEMI